VDVSSHVLETYHDSFLYGRVPLTVKIRAGLRGGFIGYMWHILEFTAALVSGVLYVYSTYDRNSANTWIAKAQNIISIVFVVDYILRIYSAPVRLLYIFSIWGFLDLISAIPIILLFSCVQESKERCINYSSFAISAYHQDIDFDAQSWNSRKHNLSTNSSVGCVNIWSCIFDCRALTMGRV
jgi:hypothetical protein